MQPPTDFPTDVNAQYPSTLGPDAGIVEVPGQQYPCVNDVQANGGVCRSSEKVGTPNNKCGTCRVSGSAVYDNIF